MPVTLESATISNNADWPETHVINGITAPPYDVDLFLARSQMRPVDDDQMAALDISSDTGELRFVQDGTGIKLVWYVEERVMETIAPGEYVRDILIYYQASVIFGGRGTVTIERGVTRD